MADSESLPMQGPPEPPARAPSVPPSIVPPAAAGQRPARWSDPVVDVGPAATTSGGPQAWLNLPTVGQAPPPVPTARPATAAAMPPASSIKTAIGSPTPTVANAPRAAAGAAGVPAQSAPQRVPLARPAAGAIVPTTAAKHEEETLEGRAIREAPSWLISALVHMLALIVLGLIWAAPRLVEHRAELDATYADQLGVQLFDPSITSGENSPDHTDKMIITPTDLKPAEDPFAAPKQPEIALDGTAAALDLRAPTIGLALSGRQEGTKQSLLGRFGGSKLTEGGVQLGLEWLARQQRSDGSWSLKGPYRDGAYGENNEAATAMALLALQGNGNSHKSGNYRKNVAAGVQYLLRVQGSDGNFYQGNRQEWLYTQGQCTIALCELYGMTKDSGLRLAAEKGIKFCVEAQSAEGGWRYRPKMDSDTSVTGWIVMALQSARMAGLDVPKTTLDRVSGYLDKASSNGGGLYAYQPDHQHDPVMTAEALLCRQYLGWGQYDPKLIAGVEYVSSHLPNWNDRDVYYWYYGTQVMHHMGGEYWKRWNATVSKILVEHQETSGLEKGSWNPKGPSPDAWGVRDQGGRLYVTCLSLYMLEIYYRHLPIYPSAPEGR